MRIVGLYSFNGGAEFVQTHFPIELNELRTAIHNVDAEVYKTKVSREKTMPGKVLYSPVDLNKAFKSELLPLGWKNIKEKCDYSVSLRRTTPVLPEALPESSFAARVLRFG